MARAVEVFRANGLKMQALTENDEAHSAQRRPSALAMMETLSRSFGEVVDAAVAGDFSKRVEAGFADDELNGLATSINNLVATVDRGLKETGEVLSALADTDLTRRVEGDYQGAFGKLKADTNAMADKLADIVSHLRDTSRSLQDRHRRNPLGGQRPVRAHHQAGRSDRGDHGAMEQLVGHGHRQRQNRGRSLEPHARGVGDRRAGRRGDPAGQ